MGWDKYHYSTSVLTLQHHHSGQVYKYITKPWDPNELKTVVGRAAETYEVLIEKIEDLRRAEAQTNLLATVVQVAQEAASPEDCLEPLAVAFGKNFAADFCIFQLVKDGALGAAASYSHSGAVENWLGSDPLVQEAIASRVVQLAADIPKDADLSGLSHYQSSGIQSHLVFPITYRQELLGVLSLQWLEPFHLREDELATIHLCGKQVAIALACTLYHP
ncbi:MAG TPA: GAF domain-containing protein [Oscillatoriaceae cyanobacterium M33_DOE_052]|uniref:GAF domain-containing protein n=1 Tax=Planktothricoides sp. SpSt-374 TaxID=2282167 RepID=A0A7C3VTC6_9CYAN|nr:GAF domain-containing protein [Oscillatoriaceae cyanobacterium M33_DOE_052]